jgi:hypothetical protein
MHLNTAGERNLDHKVDYNCFVKSTSRLEKEIEERNNALFDRNQLLDDVQAMIKRLQEALKELEEKNDRRIN